jgi:hypothetical protein
VACPQNTDLFNVVDDISDIHYALVDDVHTLFLLSEDRVGGAQIDDNRVLKVELTGTRGTIVETFVLPDTDALFQPEGLVTNASGSDIIVVGEPAPASLDDPNPTSEFFQYRTGGDTNRDGVTDRRDVANVTASYGLDANAAWQDGDFTGAADGTGDGLVDPRDLPLIQNHLDTGGAGLMGGGEGSGGEEGGGEETSGGESGGGGSLFDSTPARIYFTTSASTSGGGVLGSSVPAITLPSPGESVDLYVWVSFGGYQKMISWGLDVTATNPNVVKATATEIYNPVIWDTVYDEEYGSRWNPSGILASTLNPNGVGATALAMNSKAVGIGGGEDLRDQHDGAAGHPLLDMLYDPVADAFLVQRVRLEALPGSAGLSTGIVMRTGSVGIVIDTTTATQGLPIYLGLGTTSISTHQLGATDGSTHATITVAAGSPGAVVASASGVRTSGGLEVLDRALLRAVRTTSHFAPVVTTRPYHADSRETGGSGALRAVRRSAATVDLANASEW